MKYRATAIAMTLMCAGLFSGCEGFRESWKYRDAPVDPKAVGPGELQSHASAAVPADTATMPAAATSPRKALENYQAVLRTGNYDACWPMLSTSSKEASELRAAELKARVMNNNPGARDLDVLHMAGLTRQEVAKLDGRTYFLSLHKIRAASPGGFNDFVAAQYDHERLLSERAWVWLRAGGRVQEPPLSMVREGGVWRLDMPPAREP